MLNLKPSIKKQVYEIKSCLILLCAGVISSLSSTMYSICEILYFRFIFIFTLYFLWDIWNSAIGKFFFRFRIKISNRSRPKWHVYFNGKLYYSSCHHMLRYRSRSVSWHWKSIFDQCLTYFQNRHNTN